MNLNASPESSQQKQTTLHPNLQLALSSLTVDLEEEINRFRQSQQSQPEVTNTAQESQSTTTTSSSSTVSASLTSGNSESSPVSETEENMDSELIQDYSNSQTNKVH